MCVCPCVCQCFLTTAWHGTTGEACILRLELMPSRLSGPSSSPCRRWPGSLHLVPAASLLVARRSGNSGHSHLDPRVAWFQPEQLGPSNSLWMQIWRKPRAEEPLLQSPLSVTAWAVVAARAVTQPEVGATMALAPDGIFCSGECPLAGLTVPKEQRDFLPLETTNHHHHHSLSL